MRIEIIGLAGTGKTTITKTLIAGHSKFIRVFIPTTDKVKNYPFFVRSFFPLITGYLNLSRKSSRKFTYRELAWLMVLRSWSKQFMKINKDSKTFLFDQGPVFLTTSLYCFGPSCADQNVLDNFWEPIFANWAGILDMIVVLDASNECLYQRIVQRQKNHVMKNEKKEVVFDFLDQWREGYKTVLHQFALQTPTPRILKIDTEKVPIDRICRLIKMEVIQFNTEMNRSLENNLIPLHIE